MAASTEATPDLERPGRDRLTKLPTELIFEILSYFSGPLSALAPDSQLQSPINPIVVWLLTSKHPFLTLAKTNKVLYSAVETFVANFICLHPEPCLKALRSYHWPTAQPQEVLKIPNIRLKWLKFATMRCAFCGKKSKRRAIFNNKIFCCKSCDKEAWAEKISMTQATTTYRISQDKLLASLRHASFNCAGVWATMFFKQDVENLVGFLHGDLSEWKAKREERKRKRSEPRESRTVEKKVIDLTQD